ncbi:GntR family transcriptional regulator [Roseibium sp.]|uniref:GntR family transcriptional regulator n=1 Tax=Roseibium sp. TaxID=1936156 RepID=UPI003A986EC5
MTLAEVEGNPLKPPKGARKSWTVYQALKRRIVIGDMTHNSPMTEQALAGDFACSQGTIREALLQLQEDGLVDRRGYQGTFVTRTTDEEAIVLVRLRLSLECAGMERAVPLMNDEGETHLRSLSNLYLECRAQRDIFACAEVDRAFHMAIFHIADMPMLEPILKRTLIQLHRFTVSRNRGNILWRPLQTDPHMEIVDAMARRNAEEAKAILGRHIGLSLSNLAPEVHNTVFATSQPEELYRQLA